MDAVWSVRVMREEGLDAALLERNFWYDLMLQGPWKPGLLKPSKGWSADPISRYVDGATVRSKVRSRMVLQHSFAVPCYSPPLRLMPLLPTLNASSNLYLPRIYPLQGGLHQPAVQAALPRRGRGASAHRSAQAQSREGDGRGRRLELARRGRELALTLILTLSLTPFGVGWGVAGSEPRCLALTLYSGGV